MVWKTLGKIRFLRKKSKTSWIKVIAADAELAEICACQTKREKSVQQTLPSLMNGQVRPWFGIATRYLLYTVIGPRPDSIIVPEERFWKGIRTNVLSSQLERTFMLNWNWRKLFRTSFLIKRNPCPVLVDRTDHHRDAEARPKEKGSFGFGRRTLIAAGLWYAGEKKFSPEAKADVEHKVATMIEVSGSSWKANWLAPETREKAIVDSMSSHHISLPWKITRNIPRSCRREQTQ